MGRGCTCSSLCATAGCVSLPAAHARQDLSAETKALLQEGKKENKKTIGSARRGGGRERACPSPTLSRLEESDGEPSDQGQTLEGLAEGDEEGGEEGEEGGEVGEEGGADDGAEADGDDSDSDDSDSDDDDAGGGGEGKEGEEGVCTLAGLGLDSSDEEGADGNEKTVCRLCENQVLLRELTHHLVLCTAAHSCREELRKCDTSLKMLSSRVRKKHARMRAAFRRAEASLDPLELVSTYADGAAGVLTRDPMMTAYKLMELQNSSRKAAPHDNPTYAELFTQARAHAERAAYFSSESMAAPCPCPCPCPCPLP